jgi:N-formylglutamate amidohydrolase
MNETQIAQFQDWITDTYGTPEELAHYLDLAVEMLFYLERDAFEQIEVQDVVTALRGIKRVLG